MDQLIGRDALKEKNDYQEKLLTVFMTFLKIGLFTFGGGYAMIPLIEYETVERHHWIESEDILDIFAIAEATPGVIAVNTATFVGYKVAGFWGSLLATLGVVIPSLTIISLIALFFQEFQSLEWVGYAFQGIRAGVIVLILGAVVKMGKKGEYTPLTVLILMLAFGLASFTNINVIYLLLGGAVTGLAYQIWLNKKISNGENSGEDK
ncbi:MAG: chromate transporter [Acetobacterium sp.]|jgi:Chromate transport protein ChrA|uniref:chromate transporter n=1 Tax=Acetobacterium carbinolicum TaxID=52690 RepID=UPI0029E0D36D|nr:chromate transporter [Acetobacterium sp.]